MAEGAGMKLEELVLITLHEELYHRGVLPAVEHCTAVGVGPPTTADGNTYVGENWDWFSQLYGQSQMLRWENGCTLWEAAAMLQTCSLPATYLSCPPFGKGSLWLSWKLWLLACPSSHPRCRAPSKPFYPERQACLSPLETYKN